VTYNAHPNPTSGSPINRGHYLSSYGYSTAFLSGYNVITFTDPAANSPVGWANTTAYFGWGSDDFYNHYMGINWTSRGVTW
jgi:hypothetical protein